MTAEQRDFESLEAPPPLRALPLWQDDDSLTAWAAQTLFGVLGLPLLANADVPTVGIRAHGLGLVEIDEEPELIIDLAAGGAVPMAGDHPGRAPRIVLGADTHPAPWSQVVAIPPLINFSLIGEQRRLADSLNQQAFHPTIPMPGAEPLLVTHITDLEMDPYAAELSLLLAILPRIGLGGRRKVRLFAALNGPAPSAVVALANQNGPNVVALRDHVTFGELAAMAGAGDVYLSLHHPVPLLIMMAQALGSAVIAGEGARPFMQDGMSGRVIKAGNQASVENQLRFLLTHPDFERSFRRGAADLAAEAFDANLHRPRLYGALAGLLA
ncbi:MAG: hypothetical protein AAFX52_15120 [Pseudomonadota bacterium]